MILRLSIVLLVLVLLLGGIVVAKSLLLPSLQVTVSSGAKLDIDMRDAAERLAGAIRVKTISYPDASQIDREEFQRFHEYLEQSFPRAHSTLRKEVVGGYSLLYEWQGTDPSLNAILLIAHMDVVPIEPSTKPEWAHPPFQGVIADEFIWGRGALDMKYAVTASLEAVDTLLKDSFQPRRTIYLAFGHDEELGGGEGAAEIAKLLVERGVQLAFTLDEGSIIAHDILPGVEKPVALIGLAEKGYLTLELTVSDQGGHSSMPPAQSTLGKLAGAVHRLETNQMPASLRPPVSDMFEWLAPEMGFLTRVVVSNLWLLEPLLISRLEHKPATNALIRTTTAPTIMRGGVKTNVLPKNATAAVNFRLLPGDSVQAVIEHVHELVNDADVAVHPIDHRDEPSAVSDSNSSSFFAIQKAIHAIFPDVVVAPSLVVVASDTRHYTGISENSYRFLPVRLHSEDLKRIHGIDERISVHNYAEIVGFYVELMLTATSSETMDREYR